MEEKTRFLKIVLISGVPFGILFGAIFGWFSGFSKSSQYITVMVTYGLLFGIAVAFFTTKLMPKEITSIKLSKDEKLIYSGLANHYLNMEYRGGYLHLTDQILVFKPHSVNWNTMGLILWVEDIISAKPVNIMGIIPNGLLVETRFSSQKFVVFKRQKWIEAISNLVNTHPEQSPV